MTEPSPHIRITDIGCSEQCCRLMLSQHLESLCQRGACVKVMTVLADLEDFRGDSLYVSTWKLNDLPAI